VAISPVTWLMTASIDFAPIISPMCWNIVQIIADHCDLQPSHVHTYIPGALFTMLVQTGLIAEPVEPIRGRGVWLGDFRVERKVRDDFIKRISETLDEAREIAAEHLGGELMDAWIEPTPQQLITTFKEMSGWSDERLAEEARRVAGFMPIYEGVERISPRTIRRIRSDPSYKVRRPIGDALAKVLKLEDWHLLRWRKR
jgi:hypothetical protein